MKTLIALFLIVFLAHLPTKDWQELKEKEQEAVIYYLASIYAKHFQCAEVLVDVIQNKDEVKFYAQCSKVKT